MATPAPAPPGVRCAAHAVRPAVDLCPVCARPRCAADAADAGGGAQPGCPACSGTAVAPSVRPAGRLEQLVRSALAASGVALVGGPVAAQYVGAELYAYLTPFVVGVLAAAAGQAAGGGSTATQVRAVGAVYAVLGVALGFVLEQSEGPLSAGALLPYAAAVAGVLLGTVPPRRAREV